MRFVIRSEDARAARAAQADLARAGIAAQAVVGAARAAPDGEDIVIISEAGQLACELAQKVVESARPPLGVLHGLATGNPPPSGLAAAGPFIGALALDAPATLLRGQISAFERLVGAMDERRRRRLTAGALGHAAIEAPQRRKLRALYVGPAHPLFLSLERAFSAHDGVVSAAFSSFAGFDHLHDEVFDALVLNGAQDPKTALSLCAALRRNAALHHLPTLVIAPAGDAAAAQAAVERGAAAVLAADAAPESALGWLFDAIRRERARASAEHDLCTLRDRMGETRTGLFTADAFEAHLALLARDHHESGRPMALAGLRVLTAHGARQPAEPVWNKGFDEISSLAARLIRETDCGVALGRDLIAVALPGADLAAARRTGERIASVAECTAFVADGAAPLIFEQSAVELQPGESGAGLLARALRALDLDLAAGAR